MWLPIGVLAVLFLYIAQATRPDRDLEIIFKDRSKSEWEEAWHTERYTRCRETLVKHLFWACEKDIYRINRRSDPQLTQVNVFETNEFPWINEKTARRMVRTRRGMNRRSGSSITNECCSSKGCTWEEYAEYCPTNKRYNAFI